MPSHHNRPEERGAALLAALMMLAVVSTLAVFIASATKATADDILQHTSTQDEYWAAKSMAETVEASARTDLPTAYDLEMRQARAANYGTSLAIFDPPSVPIEQTQPVYDPRAWVVMFNSDGTISVSGAKPRALAGATSLFGNLSVWLGTHRTVPVTYATNRGYDPAKLNLTLNEAYRLMPAAGTTEPQYVVQFGIDAQSGVGGRVRQTGLITFGPPLKNCLSSLTVTANPPTVGQGSSTVLSITYVGASRIRITTDAGTVIYDNPVTEEGTPRTINVTTPPLSTTTTFIATSESSSCGAESRVTVIVCSAGAGATFTASPSTIAPGGSSTLSWNVPGASSVTITAPGLSQPGGASGSLVVKPAATTTYNLAATYQGGCPQVNLSTTVIVCSGKPTVSSFTAAPTVISSGGTSTLAWNVSDADSVTITPVVGVVAASGSKAVSPSATTTYTLTATNACGTSTALVKVTVCTGTPTINFFTVDPTTIAPGDQAILSWNVSGAVSVQINQGIGNVSSVGQAPVSPNSTTIYTLTATNPCGQATRTITLTVSAGGGGGGGSGPSKQWCDTTIIGADTTQYTRFTATNVGGWVQVAGIMAVRSNMPFPCGGLTGFENVDDSQPATVSLTVVGLGFRPYPASTCCFTYGPATEFSIMIVVSELFPEGTTFGDSMSVSGGIILQGSSGCNFNYNFAVSPFARGDCRPRPPWGSLILPQDLPSRNLPFKSVLAEDRAPIPVSLGLLPQDLFGPRRRWFCDLKPYEVSPNLTSRANSPYSGTG